MSSSKLKCYYSDFSTKIAKFFWNFAHLIFLFAKFQKNFADKYTTICDLSNYLLLLIQCVVKYCCNYLLRLIFETRPFNLCLLKINFLDELFFLINIKEIKKEIIAVNRLPFIPEMKNPIIKPVSAVIINIINLFFNNSPSEYSTAIISST